MVRGNRPAVQFELKTVQNGGLFRFGLDPPGDKIRIRHRSFCCVEEQLIQFPHGQLVQFALVGKQITRFVNQRWIAIESGRGFPGGLGRSIMLRSHIGDRDPLRFAVHFVEGLVTGIR